MFSVKTEKLALLPVIALLVSSCDFSEEAEQCNQVKQHTFFPKEEEIILGAQNSKNVEFRFVTPDPRKITLHSKLSEQITILAHPHSVDQSPMILPHRRSAVLSHIVSPENPIIFDLRFSLGAGQDNQPADALVIDELGSVKLDGADEVALSLGFHPELKCSPTYSNDGYMSSPIIVRIQRDVN